MVKSRLVQGAGKVSADDDEVSRIVPMLREYTVFNVDQCENLPAPAS